MSSINGIKVVLFNVRVMKTSEMGVHQDYKSAIAYNKNLLKKKTFRERLKKHNLFAYWVAHICH